jgi:hypothetical protein
MKVRAGRKDAMIFSAAATTSPLLPLSFAET